METSNLTNNLADLQVNAIKIFTNCVHSFLAERSWCAGLCLCFCLVKGATLHSANNCLFPPSGRDKGWDLWLPRRCPKSFPNLLLFSFFLAAIATKKRGIAPPDSINPVAEKRQAVKAKLKLRIMWVHSLQHSPVIIQLLKILALVFKNHTLDCLDKSISFFFIFISFHRLPLCSNLIAILTIFKFIFKLFHIDSHLFEAGNFR